MLKVQRIAGVLCTALLLAGCGGGSSSSNGGSTAVNGGSTGPNGGVTVPPETIQGIAPPNGVAVVTATNAD